MDCCCFVSDKMEHSIINTIKLLKLNKEIDIPKMINILNNIEFFNNDDETVIKNGLIKLNDKINKNFINKKKKLLKEKFSTISNNLIITKFSDSDNSSHIFEKHLISKIFDLSDFNKNMIVLLFIPFLYSSVEGQKKNEKQSEISKIILEIFNVTRNDDVDTIFHEMMTIESKDLRKIIIEFLTKFINCIYYAYAANKSNLTFVAEDINYKLETVFNKENIQNYVDHLFSNYFFSLKKLEKLNPTEIKLRYVNNYHTPKAKEVVQYGNYSKSEPKIKYSEIDIQLNFSNLKYFFEKYSFIVKYDELLKELINHFENKTGFQF